MANWTLPWVFSVHTQQVSVIVLSQFLKMNLCVHTSCWLFPQRSRMAMPRCDCRCSKGEGKALPVNRPPVCDDLPLPDCTNFSFRFLVSHILSSWPGSEGTKHPFHAQTELF